jgi:hypothetical protein
MTYAKKIFFLAAVAGTIIFCPHQASAQLSTVTDDAFLSTNSTTEASNLNGHGASLIVAGSSAMNGTTSVGTTTSFIKFQVDSDLPPGTTAASIAKATLKLYVNSSFKVDSGAIDIFPVTSSWTESTLTAAKPAISPQAFVTAVPVAVSNTFITVDMTALVKDWLLGTANGGIDNHGIAIAANTPTSLVAFDSKESTLTSHLPELEIVLLGSRRRRAGSSHVYRWPNPNTGP